MFRFILIVLVVAAAVGWGWHSTRLEPVLVVLAEVERGRVEATVSNTRVGTVKACRRSRLSPATGGQVSALPVREGARVSTDDILMIIWNQDLEAQIELAQSEVVTTKAQIEESCLAAEVAVREANRLESLLEKRMVSEDEADRVKTNAAVKRAGCRAARASLQVSLARERAARASLERTVLRVPFDGVVAEVNAELGEFVTPSPPGIATTPAVDLIDDSCLYVTAPIDEVDAPAIEPGMPVCVSLDAFDEKLCEATVRRIAPYVFDREKQARTVEIEVGLSGTAATTGMLPGYSADVEVVLEAHADVLRLPTEAVLEGYRVLVFDPVEETLDEKRFEPGLSNWRHTEVVSGLSEGDQIVLSVDREGVVAGARAQAEKPAESPGDP